MEVSSKQRKVSSIQEMALRMKAKDFFRVFM
jgi:hypothetical protein